MPEAWRVAMTGGTGLVGKRLGAVLRGLGHTVSDLKRGQAGGANQATWNVESGEVAVPGEAAGGRLADVIVHLAGRNVAVRWSEKVRREAWDSRVPATEKLCGFLRGLPAERRPRVLIVASGVGVYGDRGDEVLTEASTVAEKGQSFLADVCLAWEAATRAAEEAGIRVVKLRIGAVLAREGGALAKMATPVKWGLGGPVGPGTQWLSWIGLGDLCRLIVRAAEDDGVRGVINGVAAAPVRQHEFMRTLGKVLHRPTIFPLPGFMVKVLFGQMGKEVLLSSARVIAERMPAGFVLEQPGLEGAMRAELGR